MHRTHTTVSACLLAWLALPVSSYPQCADPFDNVLCVYQLSPAEEAQVSFSDGQVAGFWADWAGRDQIDMVPPDDCYPGQCGMTDSLDAQLIVRAAATTQGLYLYAASTDDHWVEDPGDSGVTCDVVELFFDQLQADRACWWCDEWYLIGCDYRATPLSYTAWHLRAPTGAGQRTPRVRMRHYDTDVWTWVTVDYTRDSLQSVWALEIDTATLDPEHRAQEWFLPWHTFCMGLPAGAQLAGRRLAFIGGYNDADTASATVGLLRWNGGDPFLRSDACYWGDLLLPTDMPPVAAVGVAPQRQAIPRSTSALAKPLRYDPTGRCLSGSAMQAYRGVAIGPNGVQVSSSLRP